MSATYEYECALLPEGREKKRKMSRAFFVAIRVRPQGEMLDNSKKMWLLTTNRSVLSLFVNFREWPSFHELGFGWTCSNISFSSFSPEKCGFLKVTKVPLYILGSLGGHSSNQNSFAVSQQEGKSFR